LIRKYYRSILQRVLWDVYWDHLSKPRKSIALLVGILLLAMTVVRLKAKRNGPLPAALFSDRTPVAYHVKAPAGYLAILMYHPPHHLKLSCTMLPAPSINHHLNVSMPYIVWCLRYTTWIADGQPIQRIYGMIF
jgi:hypothetical protein